MKKTRKLLVVFDIDETLIQFIDTQHITNARIDGVADYNNIDGGTILFRPHLEELLKFIERDPFIVPAIWTYRDREFAEKIAQIIVEKYNLPRDFFLFIWSVDQIDDHNCAKDLHKVWNLYRGFNRFNTVLVDDRHQNILHKNNKDNGFHIRAFEPFGKERRSPVDITEFDDTALLELIQFMKEFKQKNRTKISRGGTRRNYGQSRNKSRHHRRTIVSLTL
jgi:hypothetical protein